MPANPGPGRGRRVSFSPMITPPDTAAEPSRAPDRPGPATPDEPSPPPSIGEICPYLLASQGGWRSAGPSRDHRCTAVDPPAALSADKQRSLCLIAEHTSCPAFRAARAARASMIAPGVDPSVVAAADAARRPVARAAPVIVEGPPAGPRLRERHLAALAGRARRIDDRGVRRRPDRPDLDARSRYSVAQPVADCHRVALAEPDSDADRPPDGGAIGIRRGAVRIRCAAERRREPGWRCLGSRIRDDLPGQGGRHARRHRVDVRHDVGELRRVNRLAGSDLRIGQLVRIP